jgi:hypothetical protein
MLTLDSTTLYYYFLSDSTSNGKKHFLAGINDWAASIPSNAKPMSKHSSSSTLLSAGSNVPPLTNASTRSSGNSVLSKRVMITTKVEPRIQITDGGLSDEDETIGVECEAAVASPPKGKKRATSAVSNIFDIRCIHI